jgi:hypothetical protein
MPRKRDAPPEAAKPKIGTPEWRARIKSVGLDPDAVELDAAQYRMQHEVFMDVMKDELVAQLGRLLPGLHSAEPAPVIPVEPARVPEQKEVTDEMRAYVGTLPWKGRNSRGIRRETKRRLEERNLFPPNYMLDVAYDALADERIVRTRKPNLSNR